MAFITCLFPSYIRDLSLKPTQRFHTVWNVTFEWLLYIFTKANLSLVRLTEDGGRRKMGWRDGGEKERLGDVAIMGTINETR